MNRYEKVYNRVFWAVAASIVALALIVGGCSQQFTDLKGVEAENPDSVRIFRNVDGFPNINIVCISGDALIMRSRNYEDLQILFIPDNENNVCNP